jgi:hypothetical protein
MAQRPRQREIRLVDVINVGGGPQRFEIVVGTEAVRKYDVAPGEIVQIEEGYTEYLQRAPGRRKGLSILEQMAPHMKRVDQLEPEKLAALTGGKSPVRKQPAVRTAE